jgi:diaminohydroxyphosphoribosylaminopyrimidine deaminase/5-amino-6-(5-phosphoribosylamino)uracil reductase
VLVGIETVLTDDPLLLPSPRLRRPLARVVLDSRLRLPPGGRLAGSAAPRSPVTVLCCAPDPARRRGLEAAGVEVVEVAGEGGRVPVEAAVEALRARGVTSLMVEGGGEVLGSFLAARLVDQVALFRAPLLLGGRGSRPAFGGPDPLEIAGALRLEPVPPEPAFPWPWPPGFELWRPRR